MMNNIMREHVWDGPQVCIGPVMVDTCSVCGQDVQADPECPGALKKDDKILGEVP